MRSGWCAVVVAIALIVAGSPATPLADAAADPAPAGGVRSLTAGTAHTCALLGTGEVKCWGGNDYGQLGQEDGRTRGDGPSEMGTDLLPVEVGTGRSVVALDAGPHHTCAVRDDGRVVCWGSNSRGRLGVGDTDARGDDPAEMGDHLVPVDLGHGRTAVDVALGNLHTCALLDDHTVKCWGDNGDGQLGLGDTEARGDEPGELGDALPAVDLGAGRTALALAAGAGRTCALLDDGRVKCWGSNGSGALGLGDTEDRGDAPGELGDALPAVDLGVGRSALALDAGWGFTCALLDDRSVKCWGNNQFGALGLGDTSSRGNAPGEMGDLLPPVDLGAGRTASAVTAGADHACALLDDRTVKCWGSGTDGQLGQGDQVSRGGVPGQLGDALPPVDLGTGRTVAAVSAGSRHTCAVLDDGGAKCWGNNSSGRLGLGDTTYRGARPGEMGDALPTVAVVGVGTGIAGRVTASGTAAAVPGTAVLALDVTDFSLVSGAVSNGAGDYAMDVPPGTYLLYLVQGTSAGFDAPLTPVTVSEGLTPADPVLTVNRGAIAGTILEAGTSNRVGGGWAMALGPTGNPEAARSTLSSGVFTLPELRPGPHHVVFFDPTGAHVPRFAPSSPDLAGATPVTVAGGATTAVDGVLPTQSRAPATATITGHLVDTTGAAVHGALVLALRSGDFGFEASATSDTDGDWSLAVAPGDHLLGFVSPTGSFASGWYGVGGVGDLTSATPVPAPAGAVDATLVPLTGTIRGTVTRGSSGQYAMVVVAIGPTGVEASATTLLGGSYGLFGLAPGTYRLAVLDPSAAQVEYWPNQASYATATPLVVTAGGTVVADADLDGPP